MTKRLTIVITGVNFGGAEKQAIIVADGMRRRGWRVDVISLLPLPAFDHRPQAVGIPVASIGITRRGSSLLALPRLILALRHRRPDVVLTFMYHANVLGRLASRALAVRAVASSIRAEHFGGRGRDLLERATGRWARAIVVNSGRVGEALVARGVVPRAKLHCIPNAVARMSDEGSEARASDLRAALGVHDREFLWLAVGRLEKPKDYPTLLHAFQRLRGNHPTAQLRIAGSGYLAESLRTLATSLGLGGEVRFLGFRRDVDRLLRAADALVLSSAWEGSPNAVIEAMAAGTLVVATDVGGVADLVEPGHSGIIAPPGDPVALAGAMAVAMNLPPTERKAMAAAGQRKIEVAAGIDRVCDTWYELLSSLADAT